MKDNMWGPIHYQFLSINLPVNSQISAILFCIYACTTSYYPFVSWQTSRLILSLAIVNRVALNMDIVRYKILQVGAPEVV